MGRGRGREKLEGGRESEKMILSKSLRWRSGRKITWGEREREVGRDHRERER